MELPTAYIFFLVFILHDCYVSPHTPWWKQRTSGKKLRSTEPNFAQKIVIEHNMIKSKVFTWNIYFYIQKRLSGNYSALLNIRKDSCAVFIYLGYEKVLYMNESCHSWRLFIQSKTSLSNSAYFAAITFTTIYYMVIWKKITSPDLSGRLAAEIWLPASFDFYQN